MQPDFSDIIFQQAIEFVNHTDKHIFLSGKAGTGKTTFLKFIKENSVKNLAILAPTGIAAINAGGVTIHSFLQLPFGVFIPDSNNIMSHGSMYNEVTLLKNIKLNTAKRELLHELDLLIIDEVSMVRSDFLDAVDVILRNCRNQPLIPFGGVQMVYIGDLFQLPPIAKKEEWEILKQYYESPFFFDALVLKNAPPLYIELKKIYRQKGFSFINLLNNIRNNSCTQADINLLNKNYNPSFSLGEQNYITLTTHNSKADDINNREMKKLPGKEFTFEATITGEFHDKSYPTDRILHLKVGSQIMLIKNDVGDQRRYFNGKLAVIEKIDSEKMLLRFADGGALSLERETWRNIKYSYNNSKDNIEEEEIGTFTQYPIRLAWAITIHKSQGLTFERAIIDAGESFTSGQVYVALSRLTSIDGLALCSQILPQAISTNKRVLQYIQTNASGESIDQVLKVEQKVFLFKLILQSFEWNKYMEFVRKHSEKYPDKEVSNRIFESVTVQYEIAEKFRRQLKTLFVKSEPDAYDKISERTKSASNFFCNDIEQKLIRPLKMHLKEIKTKKPGKNYWMDLNNLLLAFERMKQQLLQSIKIAEGMAISKNVDALFLEIDEQRKNYQTKSTDKIVEKRKKNETGSTDRTTLQMFNSGKSIEEIAEKRKISISTVELHLVKLVSKNELSVFKVVTADRLEKILTLLNKENYMLPSAIKQQLGDNFSYGEIRAAIAYCKLEHK